MHLFSEISIPLRSDFNMNADAHASASIDISIPLRSDFNKIRDRHSAQWRRNFNPSKV